MNFRRFRLARLAVVAAVAAFAGAAPAATFELKDKGTGLSSGWAIEVLSGDADIFVFNVQGVEGDLVSVNVEKNAAFIDSPTDLGFVDPIRIKFFQMNASATRFIKIVDEDITNQTGVDWTSFNIDIEGGIGSDKPNFLESESSGFSISPFTNRSYDAATGFTFSGGVVPTQDFSQGQSGSWTPGLASGELVIDAKPLSNGSVRQVFTLKEQPFFNGSEQPLIPLPAAAWTGLSGLVGLALVGYSKNLRRLLA